MGYLFEGSPGNGKTSTVLALASHLNKDIYMLNIGAISDGGEALAALQRIPDDVILLIEDIDRDLNERPAPKPAVTVGGIEIEKPKNQPISMSLLFNALDGLLASEGRILVMTTNHPEKLDPTLIRPGRVDHRISFEPTREMYAQMWLAFFPGEVSAAEIFSARIDHTKACMAAVQELLVKYGQDAPAHVGELANYERQQDTHATNGRVSAPLDAVAFR